MTRDNNYYLNLILSQYRQPLFLKAVDSILKLFFLESQDKQVDPDEFLRRFDLDKAEGYYLDVIGGWFGLSRTYLYETTGIGEYDHTLILYRLDSDPNITNNQQKPFTQMTRLTEANSGLIKGRMMSDWIDNKPVPDLSTQSYSDEYFRKLIKLFITKTTFRGNFSDLEKAINNIFPKGDFIITDGLDGSVSYVISDTFDPVLKNLIKSSSFFPKSSGVVNGGFLQTTGSPSSLLLLYRLADADLGRVRQSTQMTRLNDVSTKINGKMLHLI